MSSLGSRLETALELLKNADDTSLFADIGSDHAFLAIEAIKRGIAKKAIASDINKMPLEKGKENAISQGVEIDFILSDGFDALEDRDVTVAAICGMGGELIAKMICRSKTAHNCTIILQPMSAQEELRRVLWDNGFSIFDERFVIDGGKPYVLLLAKYTAVNSEFDYSDLYLGKQRPNTHEFTEYCKKVMSGAEKRRLGIVARGESTAEIDRLIEECQTQITSF